MHATSATIGSVGSRTRPLLLLVLLIVMPTAAVAQTTSPVPTAGQASPVWYGVTVGGAGMRLTCDVCQPARDVGPTFTIAVGVETTAHLRVGLEAGRWTYVEDGVREHTHTFGLVAHLTPTSRRGLYLIGGAGWSGYRAGDFSYSAPRVTVGAGWDVPAFGRWVVGNVLALDAASFASLKNEDVTVVRDVGMSSLRVAVQLRKR